MKVGVIGSGIVGKTLAKGFLKYGHEVMIGTRDEASLAEFHEETGIRVNGFSQTAMFGEIIVLAVTGRHAMQVLALIGSGPLDGKTVIDATNPIAEAPPAHNLVRFTTDLNSSLMEELQSASSDANFVKAFSCVGSAQMVDPDFQDGPPSMFICGDSDAAKQQVKEVLTQFGWETVDLGGKESARAIEPLCILWCIPGFLGEGWDHAFRLIKK